MYALLTAVLFCLYTAEPAIGVVSVPNGITYANLAWGWSGGGEDDATGVDLVIVDLDDTDLISTYKAAGQTVICYVSVGTLEPFRADCIANETAWMAVAVGDMADWDEEWLDITQLDALADLMTPRFERAAQYGCDGIEPDNTDCYDNSDCYGKIESTSGSKSAALTAQIAYNQWQITTAHNLGLAIALKNSLDLVSTMHSDYDFAINEACQRYSECDMLSPFVSDGKAILNAEYTLISGACTTADTYSLSTKYCSGNGNLCTSGEWINCWDDGSTPSPASTPTPRPTVRPSVAPTPDKYALPESPVSWSNLAFGFANMSEIVQEQTDAITSRRVLRSSNERLLMDNVSITQAVFVSLHDNDGLNSDLVDYLVGQGHHVLCTFSAGALETWRPDYLSNKAAWEAYLIENNAETPRGDLWLNMTDTGLRALMATRIDAAAEIGCHGVFPMDTDCLEYSTCRSNLGVSSITTRASAEDAQIAYNSYLATYASEQGLLVGLHSARTIADDLVSYYDFALAEACVNRGNCDKYDSFISADKAVMTLEYTVDSSTCTDNANSSIAIKMCDGTQSTRLCSSSSSFQNCFKAATITMWPTSAPTTEPKSNTYSMSLIYIVIGVAVPATLLAAATVFFIRRRQRGSATSPETILRSRSTSSGYPQSALAAPGPQSDQGLDIVRGRERWSANPRGPPH